MERLEKVQQIEQQNKKPDKLTDKAFLRLAVTSILAILVCIVCLCSTTFAWFKDSAPSAANSIKTADECDLSVQVSKLPASSTDVQDDETAEEPTTEESEVSEETPSTEEQNESEVSEETPENLENSPSAEEQDEITEDLGETTENTDESEVMEETPENPEDSPSAAEPPELIDLVGTPDAEGNGIVYNLTAGEYIVTLSLPANTASGYCKIIVGDKTYYTDYILRHEEAEPQKLIFKLVVEEDTEARFVPHWGIFTRASDIDDDGVMTISAQNTQNN